MKLLFIAILALSLSCKSRNNISEKIITEDHTTPLQLETDKPSSSNQAKDNKQKPSIEKDIDLSRIKHIAPTDRIQNPQWNPDNQYLIKGISKWKKETIPFLINKLDDETILEVGLIDYWSRVTIADLAMIILSDLFRDSDYQTTISGTDWHNMIGWKWGDKEPDFNVLFDYLRLHGRKPIKQKWKKIWLKYKDRIYWDETEKCFKI